MSLTGATIAEAAGASPVQLIADGIYLLPGAVPAVGGPDGNTVVFRADGGLLVVDTGRHVEHSDQILAFAREQRLPIGAIVNTHWHLDHSSGNRRIKAVYPGARVYATTAIDRALQTFLARNLEHARQLQAAQSGTPAERAERALFLDTMAHADSLRPDVAIARSGPMRIDGKSLAVHVTDHAVTDADIWLYDRASRVAVVGDLVTLPAPFFETACPKEWSEALDEVWATPFETAIPGHGEPMKRKQFAVYRQAFNGFLACVRSDATPAECAANWAQGIEQIEPQNPRMHAEAGEYAMYYVNLLREHGGKSAECQLAE